MAPWQALLLGIVEGVTEYLPISSTGHLILSAWLLGMSADPERWNAAFAFNIVIQAGAIAAVLLLYHARVQSIVAGAFGRDAAGRRLGQRLLVAFIPAGIAGPLAGNFIETRLNGPWPVVSATFAGACLMLAVVRSRRGTDGDAGYGLDAISWKGAALIGLAQCVALWPGTSRSMMTIVAALALGMRATAAAEFSFLLGLVTLTAATGYTLLDDGPKVLTHFGVGALVTGLLASTVSAALAVRWFVGFLNTHGLAPFAWYRLVLALVLATALLAGGIEVPDEGHIPVPPSGRPYH
jgi:undecaprenyl-diphosphatase